MNKLKFLLTIPVLSLIISCGGDSSEDINASPGSFNVSISDITSVSASISWTEPTDDDGDEISYSIETSSGFSGGEAVSLSSTTSGTITGLSADTQYAGKIIASDGNGGESSADFSFTTSSETSGISDADCPNNNSVNTTNIGCSKDPSISNEYMESVSGDIRTIETNTYPNHRFSTRSPEVQVEAFDRTYTIDATPSTATNTTSVLNDENRPQFYHGVGLNGIPFDPAPAEPFIFEVDNPGGPNDGEYNWDWVFEPTNNQTDVSLDCATAHVGPFGYHYHGDMIEYAEQFLSGISSGTAPEDPVQIGWASDGFPILYKYGPDASGNIKLLEPSYSLKEGLRPGDGVTEPCGSYSGKYTVDYEYVAGQGDLDECNGIERSITLTTSAGSETFDYFYVITDDFPVMSRCMVGTPDESFRK